MSSIAVDYAWLDDMTASLHRAEAQALDYAQSLSKRYLESADDLPGGLSEELSNANYYVRQKISELNDKADRCVALANRATALCATARRVDGDVEKLIQQAQADFLGEHSELKRPGWQEVIINFFVDLKNSNWLFAMVGDFIASVGTALTSLAENIRYWYECDGGRQVISVVGAVVAAVAAVVGLVCAIPALLAATTVLGFVVAACGLVAGAIGVLNAVVDIGQTIKMVDAYANGEQAWAKIYGDQDSYSDWVKFTNFGSAEMNQRMNRVAIGIDVANFVCGVVKFVDNAVKFGKQIKAVADILKNNGGLKSVWQGGHMCDGEFIPYVEFGKDGSYRSAKGLRALTGLWKQGGLQMPEGFKLPSFLSSLKSKTGALSTAFNIYKLGLEYGAGTSALYTGYTLLSEQSKFAGSVDSIKGASFIGEYALGYEHNSDVFGSNILHKGIKTYGELSGWNRYQAAFDLSNTVHSVPGRAFTPSAGAYHAYGSSGGGFR